MKESGVEGKNNRSKLFWLLGLIVLVVISVMAWLSIDKNNEKAEEKSINQETTSANQTSNDFIDYDEFGFLVPNLEDDDLANAIKETGAGWVRPHPGPFVWGKMQFKKAGEIDFMETDKLVKSAQAADISLLITLWPYADWDQSVGSNSNRCRVSNQDQFAKEIPLYRCNPTDWESYKKWLIAIVERYDGDGENDMDGLTQPIHYWEISNEPDLSGENLKFYVGTATQYAELLHYSRSIIRFNDPESRVLIAGAAGSQAEFMKFWSEVFAIEGITDAFDIANIHAIGGGNYTDLNVSEYKKLLDQNKLTKPIWVTEAEGRGGGSTAMNVDELDKYVGNAVTNGAEKIFFTGSSLSGAKNKYDPQNIVLEKEEYKKIIGKN